MISFKIDRGIVIFKVTLYPKCWVFNHNYGLYGEASDSYSAAIKQSRKCLDCGKIQTRDIGYQGGLYAKGIKLPGEAVL